MKIIRLATPNDASQILKIYAPFINHTTTSFELEVPTVAAFAERMSTYLAEAPWLVCVENKQVIGYAYASPHRGRAAYQWNREVSVYVHQDHYRKRIAHRLYDTLFQLLLLQGYRNALAGIVMPNIASERFHQNMGFSKVGTYRNIGYKLGAWHDVTWYEKFLCTDTLKDSPKLLSMRQLLSSNSYQEVLAKVNS